MEKPWKNHGKTMEKPWKSHGKAPADVPFLNHVWDFEKSHTTAMCCS